MDPVELNDAVHMALLKIHVITGWVVPQAELMDVLIDQMSKFLQEKYPLVNPDEVEYAFRTFGTTVKDWGKQLNLSLIDEVLIPYLEQRREISDKEQQHSMKQIEQPKISDMTNRGWFEETKRQVKAGELTVDFVPPSLYEWAKEVGEINPTPEERWDYMRKAAEYRKHKLYTELNEDPGNKDKIRAWEEWLRMKTQGFDTIEWERIKTLGKRMLLFDHLKNTQ